MTGVGTGAGTGAGTGVGPTRPVVVLVGPPGAGKTTVGTALAARLGVPVRDTDADIEAAAGASIPEIFVDHGEPHFRELERAAVRAGLSEHDGVLSLGGGAVTDPEIRHLLSEHRVVFLDVSLAEASNRVGLNAARPLLLGNVRGRLKQLMDERRPLYAEVATATIDTSAGTPDEVVDQIARLVGDA
ncbi:MAG TPA: shikimate kinase [Nocardioidaceae bacterium]|nr:shikimate kinase [Nocardioidaceae bacterium]